MNNFFDENITRPVCMEVNLNNFEYNINSIQKMVGDNVKLMPVIKASGYGTHINQRLDVINKFDIVAVANVDEAVYMRELGYEKEVFVLNQPYASEIDKIIKYNIVVGISSHEFADKLAETGKEVTVHVEVGTGMGRTGVHPYKIEEYLNCLAPNIKVEGIYTHFSSADIDDEYTRKQLKSFNVAVDTAKGILGDIKYIHAAASNALINYPEARFNLVRPGIIIYGYPGADDTLDKIDLKPIAKLKATVTFLKEVEEGTSIGYSRSYITTRHTKVATIPIGYADGFRRTFSNGWEVMIRGKKVPIIGKVCMDGFMADVTDIDDVQVGDEVIIWDNENIKLEDLAQKCDTINYEIISAIGTRVPRKFIRE
ncbi:MAG: alanine racemase [Clostridia bacterium]|nr:alanine racemase [Clostridia bacterium]